MHHQGVFATLHRAFGFTMVTIDGLERVMLNAQIEATRRIVMEFGRTRDSRVKLRGERVSTACLPESVPGKYINVTVSVETQHVIVFWFDAVHTG